MTEKRKLYRMYDTWVESPSKTGKYWCHYLNRDLKKEMDFFYYDKKNKEWEVPYGFDVGNITHFRAPYGN